MKQLFFCIFLLLLEGCSSNQPPVVSGQIDELPAIYPDYIDVTIPQSIAPLNFAVQTEGKACAVFTTEGYAFTVYASNGAFSIPDTDWEKLLTAAKGKQVEVSVLTEEKGKWNAFLPFHIRVSEDPIDPYIAYRLIDPGYQLWNEMGIYQRELSSFDQEPILENRLTDNNCMNCHSFCMQDPNKMLFHMRETFPGTILVDGDKIEKLNTKTKETISPLVYPSWHPSGKYVAFSVNTTKQAFHLNDRNRVEVYDEASDVVVYDVEKHEIVTASNIFSKDAFETFPTFSPDGKTLYFCTAEARPIPQEYSEVKYNLCSVSFDPVTRAFGAQVDTLYNAKSGGMSASFPRVSPDGRYLLYTLSGYGNFSIWHKEANLWLLDLTSGDLRELSEVNSDDTESFHNWSSNSRWFVFSSRRGDGLYTRLYLASMDENGKISKPFLLPQEDPETYYDRSVYSYNVPDFVNAPILLDTKVFEKRITSKERIQVQVGN